MFLEATVRVPLAAKEISLECHWSVTWCYTSATSLTKVSLANKGVSVAAIGESLGAT